MKGFRAIKSSNLERAGYDSATKELVVEFKNGTAYRYFDFPQNLWGEFAKTIKADGSAGKFFNQHIKHLPCEKCEPIEIVEE